MAVDAPTGPATPLTAGTRDRILCTASHLFAPHGTRAVGIDTIIAQSGVAKMSLYKHFKSKVVGALAPPSPQDRPVRSRRFSAFVASMPAASLLYAEVCARRCAYAKGSMGGRAVGGRRPCPSRVAPYPVCTSEEMPTSTYTPVASWPLRASSEK